MSDTRVTLPETQYWKLRAFAADLERLTQQHALLTKARDQVMVEAGLDPKTVYALDDDTHSVTPR